MGQNVNEELQTRRKRMIYRCEHRGMKEMDLLMGRYARAHLDKMTATELDRFEAFMSLQDQDLYAWFIGSKPVPEEHNSPLFKEILAFYRSTLDV
ncbi:succinate dehydrogenase assembly factor 2 [Polycladidibacter hongkongensis]|uniref:FAD assembly factor SdhE n=1 Tax=Polycladidibacter hongkongensis TaxID=1647556 RepID=UPI00082B9D5D|nr:succinate dehydrogenase assembly factor 2 [Pseudovibrio hongkongensis]